MERTSVKLSIIDQYAGKHTIGEIFADLAAHCLQNRRGIVWTPPHSEDILKAPTVKFQSVLSVIGGQHDTPN